MASCSSISRHTAYSDQTRSAKTDKLSDNWSNTAPQLQCSRSDVVTIRISRFSFSEPWFLTFLSDAYWSPWCWCILRDIWFVVVALWLQLGCQPDYVRMSWLEWVGRGSYVGQIRYCPFKLRISRSGIIHNGSTFVLGWCQEVQNQRIYDLEEVEASEGVEGEVARLDWQQSLLVREETSL